MCDLCDGTTFCQLNVCSDCKSSIDNMEQNSNSLQQLKAEIRSAVHRFCNCAPMLVPQEIDVLVNRLNELSAV